jgi:hypothetical protein
MIDVEAIQQRFSAVAPFLDERGQRLLAAAEAKAAGYGGIAAVVAATGAAASRGRGKANIAKDTTLSSDLRALVEPSARGDPQSSLRWTCKSLRPLARELQRQGHQASHTLVGELLDGLGLRACKAIARHRKAPATPIATRDGRDFKGVGHS